MNIMARRYGTTRTNMVWKNVTRHGKAYVKVRNSGYAPDNDFEPSFWISIIGIGIKNIKEIYDAQNKLFKKK